MRLYITIPLLCSLLLGVCSCHRWMPNDGKSKVLLIGIDGATWKVILPLMEKGQMPHLKTLVKEGSWGQVKSVYGVSPIIWTSIATGKFPDKHGIDDFVKFDHALGKTVPYRSCDRKSKALWNIIGDNGGRVGIFNWMVTYPPEKVNGYMVSDCYYAKPKDIPATFPAAVRERLYADMGPEGPDVLQTRLTRSSLQAWLDRYKREFDADRKSAIFLQQWMPTDFQVVYTHILDNVQHLYWKYYEPGFFNDKVWKLDQQDVTAFGNAIPEFYRAADSFIGDLLQKTDDRTIVIVVSDHGFCHETKENMFRPLDLGKILRASGLKGNVTTFWSGAKRGRTYIATPLPETTVRNLVESIRTSRGERIFNAEKSGMDGFRLQVSQRIRDLDPDEIFYFGSKKARVTEYVNQGTVLEMSGYHDTEDGIFVIRGRGIRKGTRISPVVVVDIAPTILYLMGLPVAKDMDGKVITQAIDPRFFNHHSIRYSETYEEQNHIAQKNAASTIYDEEIMKRLRTLGYVQ